MIQGELQILHPVHALLDLPVIGFVNAAERQGESESRTCGGQS
jgi:hypothetical protein